MSWTQTGLNLFRGTLRIMSATVGVHTVSAEDRPRYERADRLARQSIAATRLGDTDRAAELLLQSQHLTIGHDETRTALQAEAEHELGERLEPQAIGIGQVAPSMSAAAAQVAGIQLPPPPVVRPVTIPTQFADAVRRTAQAQAPTAAEPPVPTVEDQTEAILAVQSDLARLRRQRVDLEQLPDDPIPNARGMINPVAAIGGYAMAGSSSSPRHNKQTRLNRNAADIERLEIEEKRLQGAQKLFRDNQRAAGAARPARPRAQAPARQPAQVMQDWFNPAPAPTPALRPFTGTPVRGSGQAASAAARLARNEEEARERRQRDENAKRASQARAEARRAQAAEDAHQARLAQEAVRQAREARKAQREEEAQERRKRDEAADRVFQTAMHNIEVMRALLRLDSDRRTMEARIRTLEQRNNHQSIMQGIGEAGAQARADQDAERLRGLRQSNARAEDAALQASDLFDERVREARLRNEALKRKLEALEDKRQRAGPPQRNSGPMDTFVDGAGPNDTGRVVPARGRRMRRQSTLRAMLTTPPGRPTQHQEPHRAPSTVQPPVRPTPQRPEPSEPVTGPPPTAPPLEPLPAHVHPQSAGASNYAPPVPAFNSVAVGDDTIQDVIQEARVVPLSTSNNVRSPRKRKSAGDHPQRPPPSGREPEDPSAEVIPVPTTDNDAPATDAVRPPAASLGHDLTVAASVQSEAPEGPEEPSRRVLVVPIDPFASESDSDTTSEVTMRSESESPELLGDDMTTRRRTPTPEPPIVIRDIVFDQDCPSQARHLPVNAPTPYTREWWDDCKPQQDIPQQKLQPAVLHDLARIHVGVIDGVAWVYGGVYGIDDESLYGKGHALLMVHLVHMFRRHLSRVLPENGPMLLCAFEAPADFPNDTMLDVETPQQLLERMEQTEGPLDEPLGVLRVLVREMATFRRGILTSPYASIYGDVYGMQRVSVRLSVFPWVQWSKDIRTHDIVDGEQMYRHMHCASLGIRVLEHQLQADRSARLYGDSLILYPEQHKATLRGMRQFVAAAMEALTMADRAGDHYFKKDPGFVGEVARGRIAAKQAMYIHGAASQECVTATRHVARLLQSRGIPVSDGMVAGEYSGLAEHDWFTGLMLSPSGEQYSDTRQLSPRTPLITMMDVNRLHGIHSYAFFEYALGHANRSLDAFTVPVQMRPPPKPHVPFTHEEQAAIEAKAKKRGEVWRLPWVEKYRPQKSDALIGGRALDAPAQKVADWLLDWRPHQTKHRDATLPLLATGVADQQAAQDLFPKGPTTKFVDAATDSDMTWKTALEACKRDRTKRANRHTLLVVFLNIDRLADQRLDALLTALQRAKTPVALCSQYARTQVPDTKVTRWCEIVDRAGLDRRLQDWDRDWQPYEVTVREASPALLLVGPSGTGKTSTALAAGRSANFLTSEFNVSEFGGSNARYSWNKLYAACKDVNPEIALRRRDPANPVIYAGGLVLMDEADTIPREAQTKLLKALQAAVNPVVLTGNFVDGGQLQNALYAWCQRIDFPPVPRVMLTAYAHRILHAEDMNMTDEAVNELVTVARGDYRVIAHTLEWLQYTPRTLDVDDVRRQPPRNLSDDAERLTTDLVRSRKFTAELARRAEHQAENLMRVVHFVHPEASVQDVALLPKVKVLEQLDALSRHADTLSDMSILSQHLAVTGEGDRRLQPVLGALAGSLVRRTRPTTGLPPGWEAQEINTITRRAAARRTGMQVQHALLPMTESSIPDNGGAAAETRVGTMLTHATLQDMQRVVDAGELPAERRAEILSTYGLTAQGYAHYTETTRLGTG